MRTVIIVLGNPPREDGRIPYNLRTRLDLAIEEFRRRGACALLMTGGAAHGELAEAVEMGKYCLGKGIPEDAIWLEDKAMSTYDNALYTARILRGRGIDEAVVVTSRFHKARTRIIFGRYYERYAISVPRLTAGYFIRNIHLYVWEMYLTAKLAMGGDGRLDRKIDEGRQGLRVRLPRGGR